MKYIYTNAKNSHFKQLCAELDDFLNILAGGEEKRMEYIPLNQLDDIGDVVISYDGDRPVGCASIKQYDDKHAEVKRVFVKDEYRGNGVARELMKMLEAKAVERGYRYLILETGRPLVAATRLYQDIGYRIIPNYGSYKDMAESICMKKEL